MLDLQAFRKKLADTVLAMNDKNSLIKEERLITGHEDFPVYVDSPLAGRET